MTTAVATFTYLTHSIRVVEIDGQPWFVAADVCRILELEHSVTNHLRKLDRSEVSNVNRIHIGMRPGRSAAIVSESGLYKLIMRSDKPEARKFQDRVTRDVLPAIRKDGGYILGEEKVASGEMDEDELVLRAVEVLERKVERLKLEKAEAVFTLSTAFGSA